MKRIDPLRVRLDPRIRSVHLFALGLILLGFPVGGIGLALDPLGMLINSALMLFVLGFAIAAVGILLMKFKMGPEGFRAAITVFGAIALILGFTGGLAGFLTGGGFGTTTVPPPPPGYIANWSCNVWDISTSAVGDAHDAITEFPDSPFVAADGGTPDLNKVIATPTYDLPAHTATVDYSVDDDVTPTTAGYIDEDAFAFDVNCQLLNPIPAVGGGAQEIPIWGQISASRTTGTNNNGSFTHVFYGDVTAGWYLGFGAIADSGAAAASHTNDHRYFSYTASLNFPSAAPLQGDWIPLGTSDGDTDGEWIAVWYVLGLGISDYTAPPIGDSLLLTIRLGTSPLSTEYRGNLQTIVIDLNLLARA